MSRFNLVLKQIGFASIANLLLVCPGLTSLARANAAPDRPPNAVKKTPAAADKSVSKPPAGATPGPYVINSSGTPTQYSSSSTPSQLQLEEAALSEGEGAVGWERLLPAALLTGQPGSEVSPDLYPRVKARLRLLAVRWEILDPRETKYILARPEDFIADLGLLRQRYHSLHDAPPLADAGRFPERFVINHLLAFNRAYWLHSDVRQPVELLHFWELHAAIQETNHLFQIWDAVHDARCGHYYVTVKRHALKRLCELIGEEAYYAGDLPPCVPLWRFQRID